MYVREKYNRFLIGDQVHGPAGGVFGRDSFGCRTVEAVGADFIVTRDGDGVPEFVSGDIDLTVAYRERDSRSQCGPDCDRDAP